MKIEELLNFVKELDRLKSVERQSLLHNGGRRENSAEHSWHLALTTLLFKDHAPAGTDIFKAVKMALLHDIVEIDAGDTFVYGDMSGKDAAERAAIERLTSLLPDPAASEMKNLWLEFEEGKCPEAHFVSAIDRFLPIYSNHLNEGHSWKMHHVSATQAANKCKAPISKGLPSLWALTEQMLEESISRGYLTR